MRDLFFEDDSRNRPSDYATINRIASEAAHKRIGSILIGQSGIEGGQGCAHDVIPVRIFCR